MVLELKAAAQVTRQCHSMVVIAAKHLLSKWGGAKHQSYIHVNQKDIIMYSLKCSYYTSKFSTINELIADIIESGMDPNYEITKDGIGMGEEAINYIQF